jgi:hypothetical protein
LEFSVSSLQEPERAWENVTRPRASSLGVGNLAVMPWPRGGGINAAKLLRACGGCLGARRRGRAWKTAIIPAEPSNGR